MTILVPVAMFGWILVSISAFQRMAPDRATLLVAIGGLLFLPMYSFDLPVLPEYDKIAAIALSLLAGEALGVDRRAFRAERSALDWPVVALCFVAPVLTSLSNGLGLYDGLASAVRNVFSWGVFYRFGRRYFREPESLRLMTTAIVAGGLIYLPLIAFEVRMSPQLSRMVYGFFPHSFLQHMRYGGFRPIVFMQHGLMVALWSAVSTVSAYWLWRSGAVARIRSLPMGPVVAALATGTVLCKSVGAILLMGLGIALYHLTRKSGPRPALTLLLVVPVAYILARISGLLSTSLVESYLQRIFDAERVQSAIMRMTEEDLFGARTMERPWLGWGGYRRGWPLDPYTGLPLVGMIDALWTISFNSNGYLGLVATFLALGLGPWRIVRAAGRGPVPPEGVDALILSLVLILYILDCLQNAMINPVYTLCAGALVSRSLSGEARAASALRPGLELGPAV